MCTVTFLPIGDSLVFTSNRDETLTRPLAFAPALAELGGKQVLFPRDPKAGGTWCAVANDGTVAVLLNGAFERHIPGGNYRRSRGLVLLDIVSSSDPMREIDMYDMNGIEPFTLLLYRQARFIEFRWNGLRKHIKELSLTTPCIYSSATLYAPEIIKQRERWFEEYLTDGQAKTAESVRDFHSSAGRGDTANGLVMNRGEFFKTQCITQAVWTSYSISLYHHDLIRTEVHEERMRISEKIIYKK
jgi:hypothetical protein